MEYFCCYNSYRDRTARLSDAELGRLFRALMEYNSTGEKPEIEGLEALAFDFIADDIDRSKQAYMERCEQNAANGSKGGRPRKPTGFCEDEEKPNGFCENRTVILETEKTQSKSKSESKDKSESENEGVTRAKRFTPPTLAEVQSYVAERHSPVDPQEFIDFYAAKGWMVGKTPMKDWKAACRNAEKWDRWSRPSATAGSKPGVAPTPERDSTAKSRMASLKERYRRGEFG